MRPITKNYSGFESQATSPNVEEIKHLHIFCDSLYFYLSYHWWGGRKPHLCCTWGSPLPLGLRRGYKIFSTVRDGAELLWPWSWVTRRCSLHWITCRPVCMAPSCPEAPDAMLGIQLYSLSCLQILCVDAPAVALVRGQAGILIALKPIIVSSFLPLPLPSLGGVSFLIGAGNK